MKISRPPMALGQASLLWQKALLLFVKLVLGVAFLAGQQSQAVIRDGGVDPNNLGQGGWLYIMEYATNKMFPNNIPSVTNEHSLFAFLKSQGLSYVIVKAGTSNMLWTGRGNVPLGSTNGQFNRKLVDAAHANGLKIFGSNRSGGDKSAQQGGVKIDESVILGEVAVADYVFNQGADGFIYNAEVQWESSNPGLGTNGPALAWKLCSMVRSNWPTKFIAHNPFAIVYLHKSFPYKEFGYWTDCVMPQIYHFGVTGGNAFAAMHWTDENYKKLYEEFRSLPVTNINGMTVNWTNAIKPLVLMRDVYNGGSGTPTHPDTDVRDFMDYLVADPNFPGPGPTCNGSDYFRSELHSPGQWAYIKAATIGNFSNVVNSIIMDDARTLKNGPWNLVKTIDATTNTVTFYGETVTDTNSFGTNYWKIGRGNGSNYVQFTPKVITPGTYDIYQWHPHRTSASTNVPFVIKYHGGVTTIRANQKTNGGNWTFLGKLPFDAGTNGYIRVTDGFSETTGIAIADGIKMMFASAVLIPAGPTGLVATATSRSQINLTWNDNSTNETGFIISRSTISGGPYASIASVAANITNYNNTGLTADTTYYYVVQATNAAGVSPNSNEASAVTREEAPKIISQSMSRTVIVGQNVVLDVNASGTPILYYQWRKNTNNLANTTNIFGAKTSSLTFQAVTLADAGTYSVLVTNFVGSALSTNIVLTVTSLPPSFVRQPASTNCNAGTIARFSVSTTGTLPMTYQWKKDGNTLTNGGHISGVNSANLVLNNVLRADQGSYSVTVNNTAGTTNSASAILTVVDPAINTQPMGQTNVAGTTVVFSVNAAGTPALGYVWRKNNSPISDIPGKISGANSPSVTIANILKGDAGNYTVLVTNGLGQVVSSIATLGVIDPIITSQPVSRTNIAGTTAIFTVGAVGTQPLNYQWKKNDTLIPDGPNVLGRETASLTLENVSQSDVGDYSVFISNTSSNITSQTASLVVIDPVVIVAQPLSQTVYEGTNVFLNVVATGTAPVTYQWQYNGTNLAGATTSAYSIFNAQVTNTGKYSVIVSNQVGAVISSNALVQVNIPFRIDNIAVDTRPNSVIITWHTTSNSTSQVEYGLTPEYGSFSTLSPAMVTNHSILLSRLVPETNYYFRVISRLGATELKSEGSVFFSSASVIVDNPQAILEGNWTVNASPGSYGDSMEYTLSTSSVSSADATFTPNLIIGGRYDIYLWFSGGSGRSTNVPVFVTHKNGFESFSVNQSGGVAGWRLLASGREFHTGTSANVRFSNDTGEANRLVVADAVKWAYDPSQDNTPLNTVPDWWSAYYFGTNVNAALDQDGDGYSSYQEYVIGSLPNQAGSQLDFQINPGSSNTYAIVFAPCLESRVYELEGSNDLSIWQPVGVSLTKGANGTGVFTLPASSASKFYRIKVRFP